jgi:NADH-quinone oxidoreductase subunit N
MLAYSSIAHTGYLMIGILSGSMSELGFAPTLVYVATYVMMNVGAFAVLTVLSTQADGGLNLHDLSGLARRHPGLAFALSVFLFSMAGLPPTSGFIAKYLVFYSAVQANEVVLVIIGVLCSAVAAYYYLRMIVYLYMREPVGSPTGLPVPILSRFVIAVMVAVVLLVGVSPAAFVEIAQKVILDF